jgi:hypothetical protein
MVKVKFTRYRPLGIRKVNASQFFVTFDIMKVVGRQPYAPAVFTPRSTVVLIFRG